MIAIAIIIILLVVVLGLILHLQNLADVSINIFFWSIETPIGVVALIVFVAGVLVASAVLWPMIWKRNLKNKKLEEENVIFKRRLDDSGILFESGGLGTEGEKYKHN